MVTKTLPLYLHNYTGTHWVDNVRVCFTLSSRTAFDSSLDHAPQLTINTSDQPQNSVPTTFADYLPRLLLEINQRLKFRDGSVVLTNCIEKDPPSKVDNNVKDWFGEYPDGTRDFVKIDAAVVSEPQKDKKMLPILFGKEAKIKLKVQNVVDDKGPVNMSTFFLPSLLKNYTGSLKVQGIHVTFETKGQTRFVPSTSCLFPHELYINTSDLGNSAYEMTRADWNVITDRLPYIIKELNDRLVIVGGTAHFQHKDPQVSPIY